MGVELPFNKDENYNTAPRQRVKIMKKGQLCKEQPPAEVSGIGCTETLRKVRPRIAQNFRVTTLQGIRW